MAPSEVVYWTLVGTGIGLLFSWIPGFHIFNILAVIILVAPAMMPAEAFPFFAIGALVAFVYLNILPSVYFSAADDTLMFLYFPSQRYLSMGRGHEAATLTIIGAVGGSLILAGLSPILIYVMPIVRNVFTPYLHVILAGIVLFMFMSEWQKFGDVGRTRLERFLNAWKQNLAGIFVFFAAGTLGFLLTYRQVVPAEIAYLNLTPMFIGFFATPWVILNLLAQARIPEQRIDTSVSTSPKRILQAYMGGSLGGYIAAFFPVITGGMGALIAGHITAQRGDDMFLVNQGTNRFIYYVGALFLLMVPTLHLARGGAGWLVGSIYTPKTYTEYYMAVGSILIASGISAAAAWILSMLFARSINRIGYKKLSVVALIMLIALVYILTGIPGLGVMAVATAIGLVAALYQTRRSYCLAGIIFPILLNMTGLSDWYASLLGLI